METMKRFDVFDVVMKLIGPIHPLGESREDKHRLDNLRQLATLVDKLLNEISSVTFHAKREEASMKEIGIYATMFMDDLRESLES